jgi:hypothetical protein
MAFQELVLSTFREHKRKPQSDQAVQDDTIFVHILGSDVLPNLLLPWEQTNPSIKEKNIPLGKLVSKVATSRIRGH